MLERDPGQFGPFSGGAYPQSVPWPMLAQDSLIGFSLDIFTIAIFGDRFSVIPDPDQAPPREEIIQDGSINRLLKIVLI